MEVVSASEDDGLLGRHFFFLFCIYDNFICKAEVGNKSSSDADTTSMVTQRLTHDYLPIAIAYRNR